MFQAQGSVVLLANQAHKNVPQLELAIKLEHVLLMHVTRYEY